MQLSRKDHICFAFQRKTKQNRDLAFTLSSDHCTAEQKNPAVTAITASKAIMLKGNVWSRVGGLSPLLKRITSLPDSTDTRRSKVKSVSVTPGPGWAVFVSVRSLLVQSYHTPLRAVTRRVPVPGRNLWSGLWYATVSDGGTRIASSLPDNRETSEKKKTRACQWMSSWVFQMWFSKPL